jgi:hypothetical protein
MNRENIKVTTSLLHKGQICPKGTIWYVASAQIGFKVHFLKVAIKRAGMDEATELQLREHLKDMLLKSIN